MRTCKITRAAIGKAKDDAIIAICYAYRNFVAEHKGLFEAMQWYNMYQSEEHLQATEGTVSILLQHTETKRFWIFVRKILTDF